MLQKGLLFGFLGTLWHTRLQSLHGPGLAPMTSRTPAAEQPPVKEMTAGSQRWRTRLQSFHCPGLACPQAPESPVPGQLPMQEMTAAADDALGEGGGVPPH